MVRKALRRGKRRWVIDIMFRKPDGSKGRYRHDAEVQTKEGAIAEERRRLAALAATGSPFEIIDQAAREQVAPPAPAPAVLTLRELSEQYFEHFAPSHLKPSTSYGYRSLIGCRVLPRLGDRPITEIDAALVREMDAQFVREGLAPHHRRAIQVALRSILCRYAVEAGLLAEAPKLPKLPKKGATILNVLSREEVERLLAASCKEHRLAFLLAAFAGLRSGEVRALRMCDVDIAKGQIVVRHSIWRGIRCTPKSGHARIIPLVFELWEGMREIGSRDRNAPVVLTAYGKPWNDYGLRRAFKRAARRAGLDPVWRFHDLRHFFVTELFRSGVPAPTVQKLAGHAELTTTQRYAHVVQLDLHTAIRRLDSAGAHGNSQGTPPKAA